MATAVVPEAGDILWIDFGPPFGHEQAGRRPALVISPRAYNLQSSLIFVCPLTRNPTPWPFKIKMPELDRLQGYVLVDQLRAIDRKLRVFRHGGAVEREFLAEVRARLAALLETA